MLMCRRSKKGRRDSSVYPKGNHVTTKTNLKPKHTLPK